MPEGLSIRMVREFNRDLAGEPPSFDHIPSPEGREAARRLWVAAFGEPQRPVARFDVLYGVGTFRPELVVKVQG